MKIKTMKKLSGRCSAQNIAGFVLLLLCGISQTAFAQFQTTIGFPYPSREASPGGIVLPTGGYAIPAGNFDHPASIFGPGKSGWALVPLNASGNVAGSSKWLGNPSTENINWMELASCNVQNEFIVAGTDGVNMTLTKTNLAGDPVWIKSIGTTALYESSACVKVDGGGNFVLVGTQQDPNSGNQGVVIVKVDCSGNKIWERVYYFNGWSAEAASVTAFSTFIGLCTQPNSNKYYITGKMTPLLGGDDQVFLLAVDAVAGAFSFVKRYDIDPFANDAGTCVQANCMTNPQGEIWISGYSYNGGAGTQTVLMLKTDILGTPIWANNYDIPNGDEFATHFTFDSNGKLIVTGKAAESTIFQGTKGGDCMLMRIDGSGSPVDWTRMYTNNGFISSRGNRVEPAPNGAYFITGQALELISPSQSANDILAIRTDNNGQTDPPCFTSPTAKIIPQTPVSVSFGIPQLTIGALDFYLNSGLDTTSYMDQQAFCASPTPCVCDFTWTTGNCFQVTFTASCTPHPTGAFTYQWDINCDGVDATTTTPNYTHNFPCGGGTYTVCLNVLLNGVICTTVSHTVVVPSTCCGPILNKAASCTPNNNIYKFVIEVGDAPGAASCQQPVVTISPSVATLSNLIYTPLGNSWQINGFAQVLTSTTTSLNFTVQSTCLCPVTGLPMTCTQSVIIPLPCCKLILVDDQVICHDLASFDVPIQVGNWSPLNNISQVSWYIMPKPAGGCPPNPWGGPPDQQNYTSTLEPLHLYPNALPDDEYCVYATVHLNDGPCQMLTSNIATITLCRPNRCSLNSYDYCYSGTPIVPGLLTLTLNPPPKACPVISIEWFDPQGNLVQTGGNSFTPIQAIGMQNDQLCYEDTFYTVKITDACGMHFCKARIRLYSSLAPIGSLSMVPAEPPFLCATNSDATLVFLPECAGDPPKWDWYQQDCLGGPMIPLPDAGSTNGIYNIGQINQSYYFIIEATNGVCPAKQIQLLVEYKSPLDYINFSASADPCVNQYVDLTLDITPCTIEGCNTPCTCTYTVDWYQDGNYIGSTPNVSPPTVASFHYTTLPLHGNYYAVLKADCCPGEALTTYPIFFRQCCVPKVMGPCFVCNNQPVPLMAQMILPPDDPCPDICTFCWYFYDPQTQTETKLGTGPTWTTTTGGCFILESDCYGCIKRDTFKLNECYSNPCRRLVHIEELISEKERPLRFYPNPATDNITVEWLGEAPKNGRLFITDPLGRIIRTFLVPDDTAQLSISVEDLPSGMFFVQVQEGGRMYRAAKLVVD